MAIAKNYDFMRLFEKFIRDSDSGRRLQKSGKRLRKSTIENYRYLQKLLVDFEVKKEFPLSIRSSLRLSKREFATEKKYWKKFYQQFTIICTMTLDALTIMLGVILKCLKRFS